VHQVGSVYKRLYKAARSTTHKGLAKFVLYIVKYFEKFVELFEYEH